MPVSVLRAVKHLDAQALLPVLAVLFLLSGCLGGGLPTQSNPSCSWTSQPPANAASVCGNVFSTLRRIVHAESTGNADGIRHLVRQTAVASRIIRQAVMFRADHVRDLHVVPTITLNAFGPNFIGAGFYLHGEKPQGHVHVRETVYLQIRNGSPYVVRDQPFEEW